MGCSGSKTAPQAQAASKAAPETPEGDFKITVQNTQGEAGLGLVAKFPEKTYILVESLKEEGLIPSWNKANVNTPDVQVNAGDMLVAINGKFGNSDEMLAECKAESVTLLVKRAPSPTVAAESPGPEAAAAEAPAAELPAADVSAAEGPAVEAPAAENPAADGAANPPAALAEGSTADTPAPEQAAVEQATEPAPTDADLGLADASVSVEPESTEVEPAAAVAKMCFFC